MSSQTNTAAVDQAAPAGVPMWNGVVMIERPDVARLPHLPFSDGPLCLVRSARTLALDGRRAVVVKLPYRMVEKFFRSGDADHCFVWAEVHPGPDDCHLELRERASLKDWAEFTHPGASTRH